MSADAQLEGVPSMLVRMFYVSEIANPLSATDVQVLVGAAQVKNRRLDITGMLARSATHFAQALEGRREAVDQVMARVLGDARHRDVRILLEESVTRRQFERWAMGLVTRYDAVDLMRDLHGGHPGPAHTVRQAMATLLTAPD